MNTKQMVCEYASNNTYDAAYVMGTTYEATRDADGKVFVKDEIGFNIQAVYGTTSHVDGTGVWAAKIGNDTYHFRIAK